MQTLDSQIFELVKSRDLGIIDNVTFKFYHPYCDLIVCTIHRLHKLSVQAHGTTSDLAYDNAKELLNEIQQYDDLIKMPTQENQRYENGYYREFIKGDVEVEFKRQGEGFVVTSFNRKDSEGFYYSKKPFPVPKDWKLIQKCLITGVKVYSWNDLGFLSGSSGTAIVENGLVVKTRMECIA